MVALGVVWMVMVGWRLMVVRLRGCVQDVLMGRVGFSGVQMGGVGFGRVQFDPFSDEVRGSLGASVVPFAVVDM